MGQFHCSNINISLHLCIHIRFLCMMPMHLMPLYIRYRHTNLEYVRGLTVSGAAEDWAPVWWSPFPPANKIPIVSGNVVQIGALLTEIQNVGENVCSIFSNILEYFFLEFTSEYEILSEPMHWVNSWKCSIYFKCSPTPFFGRNSHQDVFFQWLSS